MDTKSLCLIFFLGCLQIHCSLALFFGSSCGTKGWDKLTVKFLRYYDIPMTEEDAVDEGWKKTDSLSCDGHSYFVGNRYMKDGEYGSMALYDCNGVIAGIQAALPQSINVPQKFSRMLPFRNGRYHITAYFTQPSKICHNKAHPANGCQASNSRKAGCVGDGLFLQVGPTAKQVDEIPYEEKGMATTSWTKGKCFWGMGQHYWYNLSTDMDCNAFYPVFLLYNGGVLNAFGWAFGGDAKSGRFEHPKTSQLGYFFDPKTQPKCLTNYAIRSTQHIYFQSSNRKYFC